jgi:hypothetical protein
MSNEILIALATKLVEKNIDKIYKYIHELGEDSINKLKMHCGTAFVEYLKASIKRYGNVKTLLYRENSVPIDDIYIQLTLRNKEFRVDSSSILNLININRQILVVASGGSGKSMLFKYLFLNTIRDTDYIPIFVELRDFNDLSNDSTLIDCIYKSITNLKFSMDQKYFTKALESGRFVFFFDAYDEVDENRRGYVKKQIQQMCSKYDQNYYIVSSRPLNENAGFIGWDNFVQLNVCKLNKAQSLLLVQKLDFNKEVKDKFIQELDIHLYDKHTSFASYPLLLTIMLLTYDQYAEIPDKIHLFYQECFHTLYSRHDASKGSYKRLITSNLALDDFDKVLCVLSALSYTSKIRSFNSETLLENINKSKILSGINFDTTAYKNDLIEAVCVIFQEGFDFVFTHRTFQEYFTAKYISRLGDKEQKEILMNLFWKSMPGSLTSDIVLDILYELDSVRVERNFIIPAIKEIKRKISNSNPEYTAYNFLKLLFDEVVLDYARSYNEEDEEDEEIIEDGVPQVAFRQRFSNRRYIELARVIEKRYDSLSLRKKQTSYSSKDIGISIMEAYSVEAGYGESTIPITNDIPSNKPLFNEIMGHASLIIYNYSLMFDVLDYLEEKLKNEISLSKLISIPKLRAR